MRPHWPGERRAVKAVTNERSVIRWSEFDSKTEKNHLTETGKSVRYAALTGENPVRSLTIYQTICVGTRKDRYQRCLGSEKNTKS